MIKTFDCSVYGPEAYRQLVTLRQGRRSAADYAIEFRTLAATCEWNEQALSARFLEGLSGDIKEEILSRDPPTGLDQLVELAIRLDKRFELRRRAHYSNPNQGQFPLSPPQWFRLFQIPWNWGVFASLLLSISVVSQGGSVCIVACRGTSPLGVR